jgi:hypothetical protein
MCASIDAEAGRTPISKKSHKRIDLVFKRTRDDAKEIEKDHILLVSYPSLN